MKLLTAYTPVGIAPPYINITEHGDIVRVMVRSPAAAGRVYGSEGVIDIPTAEFEKMLLEIALKMKDAA